MQNWLLLALLTLSLEMTMGQVSLQVLDTGGDPGTTVLVPIELSEGQDITAIQFEVEFDPTLLSVAEQNAVLAGSLIQDHSVGYSSEDGKLKVLIFSSSLSPLASGGGSLVQIKILIQADAQTGSEAEVSLSNIQASAVDGTTIGVLGVDGTIGIGEASAVPVLGQNRLVFPQVANGSFSGGSFGLTLVLVNRTDILASARLHLLKSDGSPFEMVTTEQQVGSVFDLLVPAGGTAFFQSDGSGDLVAGYALVDSTAPLGGTLLFTSVTDAGAVTTEAGVGDSPVAMQFSVPVLYIEDVSNTGIAFANVSGQSVDLTLIRKNEAGQELDEESRILAVGEHLPRFVNELFDLSAEEEFQGSVEIIASAPVSAIALKQQTGLLTTFPVIVPAS